MDMSLAMIKTNLKYIREAMVYNECPHIIEEMCTCGHYRSLHAPHFSAGHGPCLICNCPQFTFESYLVKQVTERNVIIEVTDEENGAVANVTECPDDVCVDVIYRRED